MAPIVQWMMKRKGLGEIYDDFPDLSFSPPATKIRRLDVELPRIMEERRPDVGSMLEDELFEGDMSNGDRALVLYKPVNTHFAPSLKINPELITGLKKSGFRGVDKNYGEGYRSSRIDSLAVVPWSSSSQPHLAAPMPEASISRNGVLEESMEVEEVGVSSMEIEDYPSAYSGVEGESFHQWRKHCLLPERAQTTTATPIT